MLDVAVHVVSPDAVTSPISGARGAFVVLELVEEDDQVGTMILGDLVRFEGIVEDEPRCFDVLVRRARIEAPPSEARPLGVVPPELAPLLQRARGRGALAVREHVVVSGSALRLRGALVDGQLASPVSLFLV